MIRAAGHSGTTTVTNDIYLDLYDKYAFSFGFPGFSYNPLIKLRSQETNQEKIFIATTIDGTHRQRYMKLQYTINFQNIEVPVAGVIYMGTKNFPYGVYDITIWENSSATNLDPKSCYRTLHMGLLELSAQTTNKTIDWKEYEQEQQQKVYLTNTYV